MSFAPPVKNKKLALIGNQYHQNRPPSQQFQSNQEEQQQYADSIQSQYQSHQKQSESEGPNGHILQRLDILESNLSRVCNQYDSLMPFLNLVDSHPNFNIQKMTQGMKQVGKKQTELQTRLGQMEVTLKESQMFMEQSFQRMQATHSFASQQSAFTLDMHQIQHSLQQTNSLVNALQCNLKDVEQSVATMQRINAAKFQEEHFSVRQEVEQKLEQSKKDFYDAIADFKNKVWVKIQETSNTNANANVNSNMYNKEMDRSPNLLKRSLDDVNNDDIPSEKYEKQYEKQQNSNLSNNNNKFNENANLEQLQLQLEQELNGVHRELGLVRCEVDLLNDERRQQKLSAQMQLMPQNASANERKIRINNMEEGLFIGELSHFNTENTQRIAYELSCFDEKLETLLLQNQQLSKQHIQPNLNKEQEDYNRQEVDLVEDRFTTTKHEIEGAKKKYLYDMKRIEEKMEKLAQIKQQLKSVQVGGIQEQIGITDQFPIKIKKLMESINNNLETTFQKVQKVEDKLVLCKHNVAASYY